MGQKIKMWLINFMNGRYGTRGLDRLNKFMIALYFIFAVVNLLLGLIFGGVLGILNLLSWVLFILFIFRTMSRNIPKREAENLKFIEIADQLKRFLRRQLNRLKEIKTHRYRKCPNCKAVLRLKRKTGELDVTCPRCHETFKVKIRF